MDPSIAKSEVYLKPTLLNVELIIDVMAIYINRQSR